MEELSVQGKNFLKNYLKTKKKNTLNFKKLTSRFFLELLKLFINLY